jgi:hypothetical protein
MYPTLREPDLLDVVPYLDRPVRRGDVIYYVPPEGPCMGQWRVPVVHRVVRVTPQGSVRTRGDNNPIDDPYELQPAEIIGRVVGARRRASRRRIAGGLRGVGVAMGWRLLRPVGVLGSQLLHASYHALAGTDLFRRLLPIRLRPRVYAFQARPVPVLKLMMGRAVIGRYDRRLERWEVRRPFRLFAGRTLLPIPASEPASDLSESRLGAKGERR